MSLKLGSDYLKLTILESYMVPSVSLEISKWTEIAATFSFYKMSKADQGFILQCYLFVNGIRVRGNWESGDFYDSPYPQFDPDTDLVFIGGGGQNSFIGAIGKIDIFNPGAIIQYGK